MHLHHRRVRLATTLIAALAFGPLVTAPALAAPVATVGADHAAVTDHVTPVPTLLGELAVGQTVTAQPGEWPEETVLTYQWFADAVPIDGAQGESLALTTAFAGRVVEVAVTGQPAEGEPITVTSTQGLRVATTGTPKVSGTATTGSTMTATAGTWTSGTELSYQWLADGAPISGATASTLVLASGQSGKKIAVRVTGTKAGYPTLSRTSAATSQRVMRWATPTISGSVASGSTLTAKTGTWTSGVTFTYQWYADSKAISGATASTYKLATAQRGTKITVKVTGKKSGHPTVSKISKATGKVATAPSPKVSGSAIVGSTLTATPGTWTTGTTLTYQWYADGTAISGATKKTHKLTSAQKDKKVQVKVTGKKSGYATVTKSSSSTAYVQIAPTPTISGTPRVTNTLTAKRGTWSSGTTFTYQWYANGAAISGATKSTLTLSASRAGKTITVKVTGKKSGYPTVSRTSKATAAVTYPSRTAPVDSWNCPSWAPIKGNANSGIYHVPGGGSYTRTKPEECFRTESAAVAAGYRKARN